MSLEVEQLIKIIIGIFVVVAVGVGVYLIFKNQIIDFFKNISVNTTGVFYLLIK